MELLKREFTNPPLNEVACGIQFNLEDWNLKTQSLIWEAFGKDYPIIEKRPPLPIAFDNLSSQTEVKLPNLLTDRYLLINESSDKVVQIQNGRFLSNWRKNEKEKTKYPRFSNVFNEFKTNLDKLFGVFKKMSQGVEINQYELTYVNHISLSEFEIKRNEIENVFSFMSKINTSSDPDVIQLKIANPIFDIGGHLNFSLRTAFKTKTKEKLFVSESIVQGFNKDISLDDWFTIAHNEIVEYFAINITDLAKKKFGYLQ